MMSILKTARPNDRPPLYCLNQVGMTKRPEIEVRAFAKTIESQPIATIPFDSRMFGTAANNGQMIAEVSKSHRTTELFQNMANRLAGRGEVKKPKRSLLGPLLKRLKGRAGRGSAPHRKVS
jgi:pilus assembly protein CpaE